MHVELLTIGDELLLGFTVDTNGPFIARALADLGIRVTRRVSVGDDLDAIRTAVADALERTGAVITTGGLGPTTDDRTKPAVAAAFDRPLEELPGEWERLRERWHAMGRGGEPPEANRQQMMLPAGAVPLPNANGTAPGVWVEDQRGRWCAMLPGVPREMRAMFHDALMPRLRARAGADAPIIRSRTLRTTGLAESSLPTMLGDLADGVDGLALAYLPGADGIDLRLTGYDLPANDADTVLAHALARVAERVGEYAYGADDVDLADVVLQRLRARGWRLAVSESTTGGMLGARLTAVAGSSDVVIGGVIAYDNAVKLAQLGIPEQVLHEHGAVSEPVALGMATGCRLLLHADVGIGITGIAGPGGATATKPVGLTCVAIDVAGATQVRSVRFLGDRAENRHRSAQLALDMVRRAVAT
jgi:nicotinamide-nucleotide amidase